jgi:hypothetical protein
MSWLFSQALVAEYSAANCLDGEPSAQLNVMPTQHKFWRNDKTMDVLSLSRFGLTCAVLTETRGAELLTWFLAGFHAKTSALLEKAQESKANEAGFGPTWRASLAKYDRVSSTWKTVQLSLLGDSELSSVIWPTSGMTANGQCWELPTLAATTKGTGSGSVPTPRASMSMHGIAWCRARTGKHKGNLEDFLAHQHLLMGGAEVSGLNVSPSYCEFLMIWPMGWTDLKPLETDKFQQWLQQHGNFCTEQPHD